MFEECVGLGLGCVPVIWMGFRLDENRFGLCLRVG